MNPLKTMTEQFGLGRNASAATPPSLTLAFSDRKISCFVWGNESGHPQIYSGIAGGDWGGQTLEELVVSADGVVSSAYNQVSNRFVSPPTQVVLAVPYSWIDNTGLTRGKSLLMANLTRKLGLTATGFIVIPEAVAAFFKESLAITGCLYLQVEESDIYITLIRQGKVIGSKKVSRSDDIASDLEEGMVRLNDDQPYPPIVYLSGNLDLDEAKQKLTGYPWPDSGRSENPVFLQLPKFEIVPPDFEAKAIVSQVTGNQPMETVTDQYPVIDPVVGGLTDYVPETPTDTPADIITSPVPGLDPAAFGFVRNSDVQLNPPPEPINQPEIPLDADTNYLPSNEVEAVPFTPVIPVNSKRPSLKLTAILLYPVKFVKRVTLTILSRLTAKRFGLILIPLLIILIFIAGYWFTASAQVRLLVNTQKETRQLEIVFSDKVTEIDVDKLILPVTTTQFDLTGSGSTDVQGSKEVGDKAKGEVIIYNGTAVTKSLAKGALIQSATGLKFTLDDAASIPAKSTDLSASPPVDKWGEKNVFVTAADIGTEYNLAANTTFNFSNIASSSSWLIKNQTAFVNGSSRQVQAVDNSDKERLIKEVVADSTAQAGNKIEEKTKNDNGKLLAGTIKIKQKTDRFDKAVGEEADTLKLESTMTFTGQYYKSADLFRLVNEKLKSLVPAGYQQKPNLNDPVVLLKDAKENLYQVEIQAEYLPQIDISQLNQELRGKSVSVGETLIKSVSGVAGYEANFSPFPFSLLKRYPIKADKIIIDLIPK